MNIMIEPAFVPSKKLLPGNTLMDIAVSLKAKRDLAHHCSNPLKRRSGTKSF